MKAKKKPIEQIAVQQKSWVLMFQILEFNKLKLKSPLKEKAGIKVSNVAELVSKLKNEAKVI